jgi:hypothetical protein
VERERERERERYVERERCGMDRRYLPPAKEFIFQLDFFIIFIINCFNKTNPNDWKGEAAIRFSSLCGFKIKIERSQGKSRANNSKHDPLS